MDGKEASSFALMKNQTVQVALRDWGMIRCSQRNIYYLEDQFKTMNWIAIPCGLTYIGPTIYAAKCGRKTKTFARILAENQEGEFRIIRPVRNEAALVQLKVKIQGRISLRDLLEILCELGYAKKLETVTTTVFPSIN